MYKYFNKINYLNIYNLQLKKMHQANFKGKKVIALFDVDQTLTPAR